MSKDNIMNTYARFDVVIDSGKGTKVYDVEGKEYLDFVAGIAVNCLGHGHPAIIKVIEEQSKKLMHISNLYWNEPQLKLAKMLTNLSDHDEVFFCNSGTEATEVALKLARKYGKKTGNKDKFKLLYMENSFHGRTMGALTITGQEKYQNSFKPLMAGVEAVKFNDIEDLTNKISDEVCGVILEPVQGEGGIVPVETDFLKKAKELCEKHDALLIYDEVQCGMGRTGKLFAYEKFGVVPDVICMAKGIGGGFPMGAVLATKKAASAFEPGDHGCTFGGNPLACSVGLAVLKELNDGIIDSVEGKSQYLVQKINKLKEKYPVIKGIQGMGLILGIVYTSDTKELISKCLEKGLLLVGAGQGVIRIVPPLNVSYEEIDKAMEIFEEVLEETKN